MPNNILFCIISWYGINRITATCCSVGANSIKLGLKDLLLYDPIVKVGIQ